MREYFESESLDMSFEAAGVLGFIQDQPTQKCTLRDLLRVPLPKTTEAENLQTVSDAIKELNDLGRVRCSQADSFDLDAVYTYVPR